MIAVAAILILLTEVIRRCTMSRSKCRRERNGVHRALRLRQDHAAALPQSDERSRSTAHASPRARFRLDGVDINAPEVDVVDLRRRVGMVFQKSNPFPKSIYENISYGLRIAGINKRASSMKRSRKACAAPRFGTK